MKRYDLSMVIEKLCHLLFLLTSLPPSSPEKDAIKEEKQTNVKASMKHENVNYLVLNKQVPRRSHSKALQNVLVETERDKSIDSRSAKDSYPT